MNTRVQRIKNKIVPVLKQAGVLRCSVFGSMVRDETHADSDVDILVELPKEKTLFDFVDLKLSLENTLQKKVDLVEYATIKSQLRDAILEEQVQIL